MFAVFTGFCIAQPGTSNIVKVDGERYYLHIVDQGQTLYGISRLYEVTVDEIVAANPDAESGLDIGHELLIPINEETIDTNNTDTEGYRIHVVEEGQTLYSISRLYGVSIDEIVEANPGAETSIQLGQELRIPESDEATLDTNTNITRDTNAAVFAPDVIQLQANTEIAEVYNVAIMLPFYLDANDYQWANTPANQDKKLHPNTAVALDFYHGALIAIDSLKRAGLSVNVYFYDTEADSSVVADILIKDEIKDMHLFIGPVSPDAVTLVADYAKANGRFMICPAPANSKVLLGNPYVCKAVPSTTTQVDHLAAFVAENYRNENVVLLKSGIDKDEQYFNVFDNNYAEYLQQYTDRGHDRAEVSTVGSFKADDLENYLKADQVNVLVVPSNDLAYVTGFLTKLNALRPRTYENHQFVVFGLDSWQNWDNLDINYKQRFNLHVVTPNYVNYDSLAVKEFMLDFRRKFNTDPGTFGFMGYDVTLYHLMAMRNYGTNLTPYLLQNHETVSSTGFNYTKTGEESGYENEYVNFLWYHNFMLNPVSKSLYWDEDNEVWERE